MHKPIIEVRHLSKQYRLGSIGAGSLQEDLKRLFSRFRQSKYNDPSRGLAAKNGSGAVWALQDIGFSLHEGEVLGIVGGNGAGKSTLLKILSRITEPTCGEAVLRGRVASLLEVGTGFHPELTGRENIFMNAAILGMRQAATKRKLSDIIEFSGVEQFIDTPVKRYSSGMRVRLAFAVAAFLDADILIADEVLAVGDAEFQAKCLGKMSEVAKGGRTVLFVSHDLAAVQNLCTRVIALRRGQIIADGMPAAAIEKYLNKISETRRSTLGSDRADGPHIVSATVSQGPSMVENLLTIGKPAHFAFHLCSMIPGIDCVLEIYNENSVLVTRFGCERANLGSIEGDISLTCVMDPCRLSPGRYRLAGSLYINDFHHQYIENLAAFEVKPGWIDDDRVESHRCSGIVKLPHEWCVSELDAVAT